MTRKQQYAMLRTENKPRGERIRRILDYLFPNMTNIAIGCELGYDESSIRVWTKTGIITIALLRHLQLYGVSEDYVLLGEGPIVLSSRENRGFGISSDRRALLTGLAAQDILLKTIRYIAGVTTLRPDEDDLRQLSRAVEEITAVLAAEEPVSTDTPPPATAETERPAEPETMSPS